MSTTKKLRWSPEEDARLKAAVGSHTSSSGAIDWKIIASIMGRSTKQVRERYVNVLDPSIKRCAWTHEEIVTLFAAQTELGNRWSSIAARLPGRPETAVKNTFYAAVRRHKRRQLAMRNGLPLPPIYHEAMNSIPNIDMIAATTHAAATQMPSDKAAMRKRSKHHHSGSGPAPASVPAPRHAIPSPAGMAGAFPPPPPPPHHHRLGAHGEIAAPGTVFTGARHPYKSTPHVGQYIPQPRFLVVNRAQKVEGPSDPLTAWMTSDPFSTPAGIDAFLDPLLDDSELDAAVGAAAAVSGLARSVPTTVPSKPNPTVTKTTVGRRSTRSGATKRDVESDSSDVEYAPSVSTTDDDDDIDSIDLDDFAAAAAPSPSSFKRKGGLVPTSASMGGGLKAPAPLKLEDLFKFSYTEYPVQVVAGPGLPLVPGVLLTTSEHDLLKVSHPSALGLDSMLDTLHIDLPSDQDDDDFSWFTQGDALPPTVGPTMPPLSIAI